MEERKKYEQWLDDLEAKKDSTPTKVFDRVRQDYMARLQAVMEQLKEHTKTLHDHARGLMSKLRELEAQEHARREEQAEAELRANVGEITEAEWESSSRRAQRELSKIQESHEVIADELNQIREVLGGDDEEGKDESPRRAADFDELEFLKSVVGPAAAAAMPVPEPRKPTPTSSPTTAKPATPPSSASVKPDEPAPRKPAYVDTSPKESPVEKLIVSQPSGDNALGVRESEAVEQPKTLKCAECGAMNYASEWYCERCGAELAAI